MVSAQVFKNLPCVQLANVTFLLQDHQYSLMDIDELTFLFSFLVYFHTYKVAFLA